MTANNASSYYGNNECTIGCEIADTYDVNNNSDRGEKIMRINTNAVLNILENKSLTVSTYLIPDGSSKQLPYDPTKPDTAVGFTPSSNGAYSVELLNNRDDVVTQIETYLPIPKQGNNF
jgi:hypothetical protein